MNDLKFTSAGDFLKSQQPHNVFVLTYPRSGSTAYSSALINSHGLDTALGESLDVTLDDIYTDRFDNQLLQYNTVYRYFPWPNEDAHKVIEYMYNNTGSKKILIREIQDWVLSKVFVDITKQFNTTGKLAITNLDDIVIDLSSINCVELIQVQAIHAAKLMYFKEVYPDFEIVRYEDIDYSQSSLTKQWDKDFKLSKCKNVEAIIENLDIVRKDNAYFSKYLDTYYNDMIWY